MLVSQAKDKPANSNEKQEGGMAGLIRTLPSEWKEFLERKTK